MSVYRQILFVLSMLGGVLTGTVALANNEAELFYGYYDGSDRLTVNSPGVRLSHDTTEDTTVGFKYLFEKFTKTAPDDVVDAVSGATTVAGGTGGGFSENRREAGISGAKRWDTQTAAVGIVHSTESDYISTGASIAYTREFLQRNVSVTALYGYTQDAIDKIEESFVNNTFPRHKDVNTLTLQASQLLSPTTVLSGGYSFSNVDGYQANPLRKIAIVQQTPGGPVQNIYDEVHPQNRDRHTVFLHGQHYLQSRGALDLNFAVYSDSWGVTSTSAEGKFSQYLSDQWAYRLRYRFYDQSAADFYKTDYKQQETIMTADTRLRTFSSQLYGIGLTYYPRDWLSNMAITASYDRYQESNDGVDADVAQLTVFFNY